MNNEVLDALEKLASAADHEGFTESVLRFRLEKALPAAKAAIKAAKTKLPERKVIQIAEGGSWVTALCNDGSLWAQTHGDIGWDRLPPIPQED